MDPWEGTTGCTPAFSMATSVSRTSGEMPEPPAVRQFARATIMARTTSVPKGGPTATLRLCSAERWNCARSDGDSRTPRFAPSPVVRP